MILGGEKNIRISINIFLKAQSSKPEKRCQIPKESAASYGSEHTKVPGYVSVETSQLRDSGGFAPLFL
jgi:hypothetical protein